MSGPEIHIISLKRTPERTARARTEVSRYFDEFKIFPAVDGSALSAVEIAAAYDPDGNRRYAKYPMTAGELGCYLSHLHLWKLIAASKPDFALVLEDDFRFSRDPTQVLNELAGLRLADVMIKIDASMARGRQRGRMRIGQSDLIANDVLEPRTTGYLIGRNAAATLAAQKKRFFRPVDNDIKHIWEHRVPVLTLLPRLVEETPTARSDSSINPERKAAKAASSIRRLVRNVAYQANFRLGLALRTSKLPIPAGFFGDAGKS